MIDKNFAKIKFNVCWLAFKSYNPSKLIPVKNNLIRKYRKRKKVHFH